MKKRGVTLLVLSLLLPLVFASHTATVTANYASVYETNPVNITLDIENDFASTSVINNVDVQHSGFNIQNVIALVDWAVTNNNSIIFSTTTAGISNWGSQKFGFQAIADNVAQDTTNDWTITTTDANSDSQTNILQLTVLNDNTAPLITQTLPGQFIPGNNEIFSVTANDPETKINAANLQISNCDLIFDNQTNSSSMSYSTVSLSCLDDVCSANQDLTSWNEGDVCFKFDVSNKGGETANTGDLTTIIDRTPPVVDLAAPQNNVFLTGSNVDLLFNAADNYDTELDCNVNVNGNENPITTNSVNNTYNLATTDGSYSWNVACTDEVALIGTSETRTFTVDNQAPTITINAPAVVDRGTDAAITFDAVDDGSGVNASSIIAEIIDTTGNVTSVPVNNNQITYSTATSAIPGDYSVKITANDNLGHATTQTAQFRIRETYIITASINPVQIDASTPNLTRYADLSGNIKKDDGSIPSSIEIIGILTNQTIIPDAATGDFAVQIEIPQIESQYTIISQYINGIDTFSANAVINVGPYCGNNVIDNNEECDGSEITKTCSDYSYSQGTLSCTAACTIDSSQCSNPPAARSSSGGGHHSSSGSSGLIYVPEPQPETIEVIEEPVHSSGIIEPVQEPAPVIVEETHSSGIIEPVQPAESSFGIGAAWASMVDFANGINKNLLLTLLIIGILLYIFGFREKEDDWDNYFKKHGHH